MTDHNKKVLYDRVAECYEVSYDSVKYAPYPTITFDIRKGTFGYGLASDPFLGHLPPKARKKYDELFRTTGHNPLPTLYKKIDFFVNWLDNN
jgi:hypothetical protein